MTLTIKSKKEDVIKLEPACTCDKCEVGCHYGSGAFVKGQLEPLAKFLNISLGELKEKYLEEIEKFNTKLYRPKLVKKKGIKELFGLRENKPHGRCIFFDDDKKCTIHAVKPLECQVASGCSGHGDAAIAWFDFHYYFNKHDPESVRQYVSYLQNGGKVIQGADLDSLFPTKEEKEKLKKILDYKIIK